MGVTKNYAHTSIGSDRKTVALAGTPEALDDHQCTSVIITAETNNTGVIFVGDANVSATPGSEQGFVLFTAQTSPPLFVSNTNLIYIDTTVNGDGVSYAFFD